MIYGKIDRYILIGILIVAIAILYFVFNNKKETTSQSELLLVMAKKMGASVEDEDTGKKSKQEPEETEQDSLEIVRIAEKIYSGKSLTEKEKKFQKKFPQQIEDEMDYCNLFYPLVKKFANGQSDFTEEEKLFYENNKETIDDAVQEEKSKIPTFNQQAANETEENIEETTTEIQHVEKKGANPPLAQAERLKLILGFFEDGIPKTISELTSLYAHAKGINESKGNTYNLFGRLEEGTVLTQKILIHGHNRMYYGLPEWFDGKKMKKEYKQKIT